MSPMVEAALIQTDEQRPIQAEIEALQAIVNLMEHSTPDTRRRVMAYLNSRYPFPAFAIYARK